MYKSLLRTAALAAAATTASAVSLSAVAAPANAASSPTYTIAYEGPLSGGDAQLGLNMKYAVELAINQANAGTSVFGKLPFTLKFLSADDQGLSTASPTTARQLIGNSSVVAVVGPAFSGATKAAEPLFSAAHLATVSPSATNPALAHQGWHNFFRVVPDDNAQGPVDASFASKVLHVKTVDTIDDASAYGAGLAAGFATKAKALGLTVTHQTATGTTQCAEGTGDVSQYPSLATEVVGIKPQLVYYAGYYCGFALVAKALRAAGYTGTLMSGDGSLDPRYIKEAGTKVANGTYISCPCVISKTGAEAPFAKAFQKLAGFAVGTYSAEAYDATNTIIDVMKSLGPAKINRAAIVNALHSVTWKGLTKVIHFQADGNITGSAVDMYHVVNGQLSLIGLVP